MPQYSMVGSEVILYINNNKYSAAQSISFTVSYEENVIYGIDSQFGQEICGGKVSITGSVKSLRIRNSGGLEGVSARNLIVDIMSNPYISLRITSRVSGEDVLFIPRAKVTSETHSVAAKGVYSLSFNFVGLIPEFALDRTS